MVKGFRQIACLTALSRVFGLVRDIAYSHFFGANQLFDAWIIAFKIPNLSRRLFGEGAASASFIPIYSERLHADRFQASRLANTVVTVLFVVLAAIVLAGEVGIWAYYKLFARTSETQMILSLSSIMLPYMLLVCMVAILAGILNVHGHFAAPAAAPIVLNIFIIGSILITGWVLNLQARQQLFYVAIAVVIAGLVQLAIQVPPLWRSGVTIRPAWDVHSESFKRIILLMGPMVLGLTVTQINTLADDLIAWWLSGSPEKGQFFEFLGTQIEYPMRRSSVSYLYYAQRLYQLPLGVLGISLATAIFPVMSTEAAKKDFNALCKTISRGIRGAVFVAIPATVGLIIVARPLISAAFEHGKFTADDTEVTAWTLLFYALGLSGFFIQQIVTRAFYSMHDSRTPTKSALIAVFANVFLNLTLVWFMATAGLALSTAICSYLQVTILIFVLRKRFGSALLEKFVSTLAKTLIATILMGLVGVGLLALCRNLPSNLRFNILRLAVVVPSTAATYFLMAKLLRIEMLSLLTGRKLHETDAGASDN